jgi:hypothetical protein
MPIIEIIVMQCKVVQVRRPLGRWIKDGNMPL